MAHDVNNRAGGVRGDIWPGGTVSKILLEATPHQLVLRSSEMHETAAAIYTTTVLQLPTFGEPLEPFPKGAGLDDQGC